MKLLPYENFSIISSYKPDEVLGRMTEATYVQHTEIVVNKSYSIYPNKYFVGNIRNTGFDVKPDTINVNSYLPTNSVNSFLPNIKAEVKEYSDGSKIQVEMRIAPWAIIFVCFCFVFISIATITTTTSYWILIVVFLFLYLLIMGAFKSESNKAINVLLDVFNGEIAS